MNITECAWVNAKSFGGAILAGSGAANQYSLFQVTATALKYWPDQTTSPANSATLSLNINAWYHVCITQLGQTTKFYLNGADVSNTSATSVNGGDAFERIGADPNNSFYFNGTLDDVRLYNRALSATEVKQLYNAGR
jgi:hypothetical protein